jgi:TATA-binding protein-associated factor
MIINCRRRHLFLTPRFLPYQAHRFLKFTKWETRIAAGLAIEAISNAVAVWNPKPDSTAVKSDSSAVPTDSGRLALESFDITAVLKNGIPLLGSSGEEYASFENALDSSALANQRQIIKSQLGLGGSYGADLVDDDDLMAVDTPAQPQKYAQLFSFCVVQRLCRVTHSS